MVKLSQTGPGLFSIDVQVLANFCATETASASQRAPGPQKLRGRCDQEKLYQNGTKGMLKGLDPSWFFCC